MMKREPRYTKEGIIFKQDRHYVADGWPETRMQPIGGGTTDTSPPKLAAPNPMKRKGRC